MNFKLINEFESEDFSGFITIDELMKKNCSQIPNKKGIYFIIRKSNKKPTFMRESIGGHFKGKNPTVDISKLERQWNENTLVIYIGKAGGDTSNATLQSRILQYMKFGKGIPIGHWGGRCIWQLEDYKKLVVCWKVIEKEDCRKVEKELIKDFLIQYDKRPFANLVG